MEVKYEGEGGEELVPGPGHLALHNSHAQDAGQAEGGVERELVGGDDDVGMLSVEEDGPETGEAGEEDVGEGGVEDERSGGGTGPGPLSEDKSCQPAEAQQTEEGPLQEEVVVTPLSGPLHPQRFCLLTVERSSPD